MMFFSCNVKIVYEKVKFVLSDEYGRQECTARACLVHCMLHKA